MDPKWTKINQEVSKWCDSTTEFAQLCNTQLEKLYQRLMADQSHLPKGHSRSS